MSEGEVEVRWGKRVESIGLLAVLWLFLGPGGAAGENAPASKLTITQTTVRMDVAKSGFADSRATPGTASGVLLVSNQGTAPAKGIKVTGFYGDGMSITITSWATNTGSSIDLQPNDAVLIHVSFDWSHQRSDTGWLVVAEDARSGPPATVPFQIHELVRGWVFAQVFIYSAVAALLVCLWVNRSLRRRPPTGKQAPGWSTVVTPGTTWSFKDSWASNLTALGAILGTVLAASGFLTEVLPGLSTGMFVGMSLGYGFLALLAPVVYTAAYKDGSPMYRGVLLAGGITVCAVIGELITIAQLIGRGGLPIVWGYVGVLLGLIVMTRYARASIAQVLPPSAPVPVPPPPTDAEAAAAAAAVAAAQAVQYRPAAIL